MNGMVAEICVAPKRLWHNNAMKLTALRAAADGDVRRDDHSFSDMEIRAR